MLTAGKATASAKKAAKDDWVERQLRAGADAEFRRWMAASEELRIQILVTIVDSNGAEEAPKLTEHGYRVDAEYIYPASAIKPFVGIAALRYLHELGEEREAKLDGSVRFMRCKWAKGSCEVPKADVDRTPDDDRDDKKLRVGQELRKMLAYSDNVSFDRFYDLVGHRKLNEIWQALGLSSVRIHHRLSTPRRRLSSRRVLVLPWRGRAVVLPQRKSDLVLAATPVGGLNIGSAHRDGRRLVKKPMDFGAKNYASLRDMHRLLLSLTVPKAAGALKLGLSENDLKLVKRPMRGKLVRGKRWGAHKPMLPGVLEVVPRKHLTYLNKSGRAYGFELENAYLADARSGRAMLVTAAIYANPNGVLNDDDYDYKEVAGPFMEQLGKLLSVAVFGKQSAIQAAAP